VAWSNYSHIICYYSTPGRLFHFGVRENTPSRWSRSPGNGTICYAASIWRRDSRRPARQPSTCRIMPTLWLMVNAATRLPGCINNLMEVLSVFLRHGLAALIFGVDLDIMMLALIARRDA
jgi:hypothetical protein